MALWYDIHVSRPAGQLNLNEWLVLGLVPMLGPARLTLRGKDEYLIPSFRMQRGRLVVVCI